MMRVMKIRTLYLYLFSFVGLLIVTIGSVQIVDLGLKVLVFRGADKYDSYPMIVEENKDGISQEMIDQGKLARDKEVERQRQRQLSTALAMIGVGTPLYLYHWRKVSQEES